MIKSPYCLLGLSNYNSFMFDPVNGGPCMEYAGSERVELKQKLTDDVKKEIVAFLNSNGGTIYVGVKDNGELEAPLTREEKDFLDTKLANWVNDVFYPSVSSLIRFHFQGDGVFAIEVNPGLDKPYYIKEKGPKPSGIYLRVGTASRMASENEILLMLLDSRKYSYEEDVSEEQELTFHYFDEVCEENHIPHEKRNLCSFRMINKFGEYTNLALMMSDQSPIVVKFAKYDRNLNFTTKKEYSGSLLKVLNNVLENAANYNDVSAVINRDSWQRIETISYPGASLREGILNAFCHSNYFIRSNIKVEFFEDRAKITNPGGIFQATLKQIMEGVQTYRNPGLVNILNKLHYLENFGTGIPRILEAYRGAKKQPIFDPSDNFFLLTLPNLNYRENKADPINDPVNDPVNIDLDSGHYFKDDHLGETETSLLRTISSNPGLNANKLLEKVKRENEAVTLDIVKNAIKRKLTNYVEFKGAPKTGGYYLKEKSSSQKSYN